MGYWQAVWYLGEVERRHGQEAALFELSLQQEMDTKAEQKKPRR
jgi:hypothetical protein